MYDFNDVQEISLIPAGTVVRAKLALKPGALGNLIKTSKTGSKFLEAEFTVLEGQYAKRKVYHLIGIEGNEEWVEISKRFIKNLLESANGIAKNDKSERAVKVRTIENYSDLEGLEVVLKIGIETSDQYADKNKVQAVLTAESPVYQSMIPDFIPWN